MFHQSTTGERLHPEVRRRLWAKAEPHDRRMLADVFERVPRHIAPRLLTEWESRLSRQGRYASNNYVTSLPVDILPELFHATALPFDASDDDIADAAKTAVKKVHSRLAMQQGKDDADIAAALSRVAHSYQVNMPTCKTLGSTTARMMNDAWWRRALRRRFQIVEHAAIKAGCIHRRAAPYVSNEAMRRHERHARKTTALLEALEAVNENTGECASLAELRNTSTANPAIRRYAMMACIRGLEERAKALQFVAVFVTITCPSRMHARLAISGDANSRYDGTSPRAAQTYLARKVWNGAMRKLAHAGIVPGCDFFGLRTVEPHHDGTPHWHVLVFIKPGKRDKLIDTLRAYALADSTDEPGAAERRFTAKDIDPAKGSATGYIAKYISKGTDGAEVGEDYETGKDATTSAPRVVVWARAWHARQFQFFGVGAVSPFRELYRLDAMPEPLESLLGDLWRAARDGDFAAYLAAREARQTRPKLLYEACDSQRYPGEQVKRVHGITVDGDAGRVPIVTRPDRWRIQRRPDASGSTTKSGFLPSLGLDSITPRNVDYQGFFRVSRNEKQADRRTEKQPLDGVPGRAKKTPLTGHRYPAKGMPVRGRRGKNKPSEETRKNFLRGGQ